MKLFLSFLFATTKRDFFLFWLVCLNFSSRIKVALRARLSISYTLPPQVCFFKSLFLWSKACYPSWLWGMRSLGSLNLIRSWAYILFLFLFLFLSLLFGLEPLTLVCRVLSTIKCFSGIGIWFFNVIGPRSYSLWSLWPNYGFSLNFGVKNTFIVVF